MSNKRTMLILVALLLTVPLALSACDGSSGKRGLDGAPGGDGSDGGDGAPASKLFLIEAEEPETLVFGITALTIASPLQVDFTVADDTGRGGVGLGDSLRSNGTDMNWARFSVAKLVPGADGNPDEWVNYIRPTRGTYERIAANLTDNEDGTYTYTFDQDLDAYAGVTYEPSLTHRLVIQSSGGTWDAVNLAYDFVPAQLPGPGFTFPLTRDIVTSDSCNECHGDLRIHGSRYETKYCVVCHNAGLGDGDMTVMTHAIHAGDYRETAYELGGDDFSHVVFPQELAHCAKCHKGPDGDNWKDSPSIAACGSCHDEVDFSNHAGAARDNSSCDLCHSPTANYAAEKVHITENATMHNPLLPDSAVDVAYEIDSVTAGPMGEPIVVFRIMLDGVPAVFDPYDAGDEIMITGFTDRAPGFAVAWALPQNSQIEAKMVSPDEMPDDYNNLLGGDEDGAGQPIRVDLDDVWNGNDGTLTGPDMEGWYTATLNAAPFPPGSTMRAVALQGYFQQLIPDQGYEDDELARHAVSVIDWVKYLDQDEEEVYEKRRDIVDSANCANCHEWFEGHGGNRVYTVQVCAVCHVPNLSSSGRTGSQAGEGWPADPLDNPEDTNNLKDLIHGIHASHDRENPYRFVRASSRGTTGYDWSHILFPTDANKCETCHLPGTYRIESIPAGALPTTVRTTTGNEAETVEDIEDARLFVPNSTDIVNSPISSTCYYCHDSENAVGHMEQNGGMLNRLRQDLWDYLPLETCDVCHGEGKVADVELVHEDD